MRTLASIIILCLISTVSFASGEWKSSINKWGKYEANKATTYIRNGARTVGVEASISHSTGGEKLIYLTIFDTNNSMCSDSTTKNVIGKVNGQAIKLLHWCTSFNGGKHIKFIQTTASSKAGENFIVNAFKKETSSVFVEIEGTSASISSVGFTKEWNAAGGDAL